MVNILKKGIRSESLRTNQAQALRTRALRTRKKSRLEAEKMAMHSTKLVKIGAEAV